MKKPQHFQMDDLTCLYNRKSFLEEYHKEMEKAKADHIPVSLVFIDIDEFMRINDQFGHLAGDQLLVEIAHLIQEDSQDEDIICRYGGDEFVMLLPAKEREQAFLTIENIRAKVEKLTYLDKSSQVIISGITISGGVASYSVDGSSDSEILRKADQALYRAKKAGRNKIRLAYDEKMVPKTVHFTQTQLERLTKLSEDQNVGEAELLREAMDDLLIKYGVNDIET